ncbi:hypothetical protein [Streptomyces shenzhenensis]|uniref:Uncharacterized protein n=1 Tax=Streptomyces shenzhenensis TaxID=943815 RepID=A0A3M0IAN0_9ACTN|nr:hypothetical protein [Streptomyces shenzhenensis]RMB85090.1 hypothetical protein CTZ28_15880 [Streptomyces shenzhenensis]
MGWLSWLTGRRGSDPRGDGAQGPAPAHAPETSSPPVRAAGWRDVPPLQRTVDAPALITDPVGFRGSLDTWRDASFFTPLGHLVSPQAPSGLGHGLATPAASEAPAVGREVRADTTGGAPQPDLPVQRTAGPAAEGAGRTASTEPLVSARPPAMRVRQLTAVTVDAAHSGPPTPPAPSAPSTLSPPAPPVQRAAAPDRGLPHAFGLGEPLAELPLTARREDTSGVSVSPSPDEPAAVAPSPDDPSPDPPAGPLLSDDPLVLRTAVTGPLPEPTAAATPVRVQRTAADGTPAAPGPGPSSEPSAPLVAQRSMPLFSGVRPPEADGASEGPEQRVVVPVSWSHTAHGHRASDTGTPAGSAGDSVRPVPVPVTQRSVAPAAAPPAPPAVPRSVAPAVSRSPVAVDAGSVAVAAGVAQRMADGSVVFRPVSASPVRPAPQPAQPSATVPSYASVPLPPPVQRARADLSAGPVRSTRFLPPVQRDVETTEPDPPAPPVPPAPPDLPDPPAPSSPEPVPGASATAQAAPGDGGPGPGGPPKVDDELVRALFAPLSRLLKAELRLDRERAGHLINTRH